MRKILLIIIVSFLVSLSFISKTYAIDLPQYSGFVNDYENILDNDEQLNQQISELEKRSGVEIAIVTTSNFQGTTIEDYAVKLFEKWGIGKADKDNGLLIIVSKEQRQSRFEVGYGLEGTLPDSLTGRIQDEYMIPQFKEGNYSKGVQDGLDATIGVINNDPTVVSNLTSTSSKTKFDFTDLTIIILIFGIYLMAPTKSWWLGGVLGFILGCIWAYSTGIYILPFIFTPIGLILDFILSKTPLGAIVMSSGRSGGGFGGSSSGGGISFGGGSSGGGGSSRSW